MRVTRTIARLLPVLAVLLVAGCDLPFGLGQPATRALEAGAAGSLDGAFELTGSYDESGTAETLDLQVAAPGREHVVVNGGGQELEAVAVAGRTYFRGREFLAQHIGSDAGSQTLLSAAGNAWWVGLGSIEPPRLPDFATGAGLTATFLGSNVTRRVDGAAVDGRAAVKLSGPRGDVYVSAYRPYPLLRLVESSGARIDALRGADFRYSNFGRDFGIAAPADVIDFSNLSTLPPIYTVVSVDVSGCAQPCVMAAVVRNLGGLQGAKAPSTVRFTVTDRASGAVLGGCTATVSPDVGYNATTEASCTVAGVLGQPASAETVTATPSNPGHG